MYHYEAYGLRIASEIELPELPAGFGEPDVTLRIEPPPPDGILGKYSDRCLVGRVKDLVNFVVEDGRRISIIPNPDKSEAAEEIGRLIFGVLIGAALQQRGFLVLHGSSLLKDGLVTAFLGDCGTGKSTTAEYFSQQGYVVLDDDLLVIDVRGARPTVLGGISTVRLREDAGVVLRDDYEEHPLFHQYLNKRIISKPTGHGRESYPLSKIYVFESGWYEENAITPMPARDRLIRLVANSYLAKFDLQAEQKVRNMRQCQAVCSAISISYLRRKKGVDQLADIYRLIEDDVAEFSVV